MRHFPLGAGRRNVLIIVSVAFVILCSTLLLGKLLPHGKISIALHKFSNYWLGLFIYLLFFIIMTDVLVIVIKQINRYKPLKLLTYSWIYPVSFSVIVVLAAFFVVYGTMHAKNIVTNSYEVTVKKDGGKNENLNIVLVSDFHLGYSVGCAMMESMVEKINVLQPDLVIVAGDIVDNDYDALDDPQKLAEILRGIQSRYGVYATYGNHDVAEVLIGGFSITPKSEAFRDKRVEQFLSNCGFTVLEDEVKLIDDSFYLIGRLDGEKPGDGTTNRASIETLTYGLDPSLPCIVVAHEPDELRKNADCKVDILLNGHTHAGQFFPLTLSQPLVWKNTWGYLKIDEMHDFVSSGIGVYGPNIRVATDSEVMQIKVNFEK